MGYDSVREQTCSVREQTCGHTVWYCAPVACIFDVVSITSGLLALDDVRSPWRLRTFLGISGPPYSRLSTGFSPSSHLHFLIKWTN